jgi:hypothetical protein
MLTINRESYFPWQIGGTNHTSEAEEEQNEFHRVEGDRIYQWDLWDN